MSPKSPQCGSFTRRLITFQSVTCRTSEAPGQNFKGVLKDQEKKVYYMPCGSINVKLVKGMRTYTDKHLGLQKRKNPLWSNAGVRSCV